MNWLDLFTKLRWMYPDAKIAPEPAQTEEEKERDLEDRVLEFMELTHWNDLVQVSCETVHPIIHRVLENVDPEAATLTEAFSGLPLLQEQIASCVGVEMAEQLKNEANGHMSQRQYNAIIAQVAFGVGLAFQVERIWRGETHDLL